MRTPLPQAKAKLIRKLHMKKYRDRLGLYPVEKAKTIAAYVEAGRRPEFIVTKKGTPVPWEDRFPVYETDAATLRSLSGLKNPYDMLAVFPKPSTPPRCRPRGLVPVFDRIQDPGNLGTVIRTADWFGIRQIVCTPGSADIYNPKTVQAAMGALARVEVCYLEPDEAVRPGIPLWITDMEGDNIYEAAIPETLFVVFGNEGHGIGPRWRALASRTLTIPHAPDKISESLNVSVAAAIVMSEWFRRHRGS
ncbi:MAG: RNA methyltransferase [Chlorobi bacterium]|nr:RNA methyltransferase [Chlorobiota bacterium]